VILPTTDQNLHSAKNPKTACQELLQTRVKGSAEHLAEGRGPLGSSPEVLCHRVLLSRASLYAWGAGCLPSSVPAAQQRSPAVTCL